MAGMSSPASDHEFWNEETKRDLEAYEKDLQGSEAETQLTMLQESIERDVDEEQQNVVTVLQDMVEERLSQEDQDLLQSIVEEYYQGEYSQEGYAQEEYGQEQYSQEDYAQGEYAQDENTQDSYTQNQEYIKDFYVQQQQHAQEYAQEYAEGAYEESPQRSVARARALALHEELVADELSNEGDNEKEHVFDGLDDLLIRRHAQQMGPILDGELGDEGEGDGEYDLVEDEELYKLHN